MLFNTSTGVHSNKMEVCMPLQICIEIENYTSYIHLRHTFHKYKKFNSLPAHV